jgi:hypothetical protein
MDRLLTREKLEPEKEHWKQAAATLLAIPDTGNRFAPFSYALNRAIRDNEAPWKVPGPNPDDLTNSSDRAMEIYARALKDYNAGTINPSQFAKLKKEAYDVAVHDYQEHKKKVGVWTDDYSNVLSVFSWK